MNDSASPSARPSWAGLAAVLAASAAVGVASLVATHPPGSFEIQAASLGRVLLAAGCGACLGAAGAVRLRSGSARALAELELIGGLGGATIVAWLAAWLAPESASRLAGFLGAALGGGAGVFAVHSIDRPARWSNLAAALIVGGAAIAMSFALPLAAGEHAALAPLFGWLFGDLSTATLQAGAAMAVIGVAAAGAATRSGAGSGTALVFTAAVWAAAGPLAGVVGIAPRLVRRVAVDLQVSGAAFALASAAAGGAAVVGVDATARMLLGGFAPPFNIAVVFLAPLWLVWNRARLANACGPASPAMAIAEWLLIAALTIAALATVVVHVQIVRAAY